MFIRGAPLMSIRLIIIFLFGVYGLCKQSTQCIKMCNRCFFLLAISLFIGNVVNAQRPNIIFIIADDLGWNDVGFHGSNEIPTPNIDALAYSGLILNNYYVNPICTPSRSTLMTGRYPIHTGMQHTVLFGAEARGLPLTEKLLPQYLKERGYRNHIVGKWHLGSYTKQYLPLSRGFDSHLGFWTGHQDYFDHSAVERPGFGLDMRRNMAVAYDLHGQYSTDIFTDHSVKLINMHNKSEPLFLYLAHAAVHSGNPYNPLPAPDADVNKFEYIEDYNRRRFAAMLHKLDESVGKVVKALNDRGMLRNSIVIFTTDNGGPAAGFNLNAASNWPLKGVKNTLWEGGVRGAACIWTPYLTKKKRVSLQRMHIADWLPTLLGLIDGNASSTPPPPPKNIDGLNIWPSLTNDDLSPRSEILHNIDDEYGNAAVTVGPWKLVKGRTYDGVWDNWYGPDGRNYSYNIDNVANSLSGKALQSLGKLATPEQMKRSRQQAEIKCKNKMDLNQGKCDPVQSPCLFNVVEDPCEMNNVADLYPTILQQMEITLNNYNNTAIPPTNLPLDPRGDPKYWNYIWTNFGDYVDYSVKRL